MDLKSAVALLPTKNGIFQIIVWPGEKGQETTVLVTPKLNVNKPVLVRIHSECLTGDTFGSLRCDCGRQKEKALDLISKSKNGIFIYLRQEGRGIGLYEKIRAYTLQEQGYDTHEANILLGHAPDPREYSTVKHILTTLGINEVNLITNNPSKVNALREYGFTILSSIPLKIRSNKYNKRYLETKKIKFKHTDLRFNSNYYLGITGITKVDEIKEIAGFVNHYSSDPLLRIGIGISANSSFLTDKTQQENVKTLLDYTSTYYPTLIPLLHYDFEGAKIYMKDMRLLAKYFGNFTSIVIHNLDSDQLRVIKYASKYFKVLFAISDKTKHLLSDPDFMRTVKNRRIFIILDNSTGKGIKESRHSYEEKINKCLEYGINDIGLTGGFGPGQLKTYLNLKNYYTRLLEKGELDLVKVRNYLDQLLLPANA
jgi:GTP cyclohydrolase II